MSSRPLLVWLSRCPGPLPVCKSWRPAASRSVSRASAFIACSRWRFRLYCPVSTLCRPSTSRPFSSSSSAPQTFSANSHCGMLMCLSSSTSAGSLTGYRWPSSFAAASIAALGLQGIAARLDHPLRLPGTRRRTAAPWHQTLRAALDWSYRLLTEEEQRVLRRLSVFAGSFTMDAAAAVAADPTYAESDIVDRGVALVSKSLVAADPI